MGGRKERNRRCCLPSSSVASAAAPLRSDSWNAPDIKWFVQSHIAGRGGGGGGGRGGSLSGHSLGWHHRIELSPLLVLVFVCAPPLSIRNAQSERRCLSSMYVYGVGVRGIPCFSQRGERPRRGRLAQLRHSFALRTCTWRMGREREDARLIGNERVTLRNLRERRQ